MSDERWEGELEVRKFILFGFALFAILYFAGVPPPIFSLCEYYSRFCVCVIV